VYGIYVLELVNIKNIQNFAFLVYPYFAFNGNKIHNECLKEYLYLY
jgi:hypothetical protein